MNETAISMRSPRWRRSKRLLVAGLLLLGWTGLALAQDTRFGAPLDVDVARQEASLRKRVLDQARELLGAGVVDVVASISYVRNKNTLPSERIKLPGFERYIIAQTSQKTAVYAKYIRLRQVTVVVDDKLAADVRKIERELNARGKFVRAKGDDLKVITLSTSKPDKRDNSQATPREELAKKEGSAPPETMRPGPPIREPESTKYLIRARTSYFKQDYNRALDHILKAIEVEPKNAQAFAMLGSLYFTINWKNLAIKYWEISLDLEPKNRELEDLVANVKNSG